MKIILSRKGFDSSSGGYASPILPSGKLISLPIPDEDTTITYENLKIEGKTYYDIIRSLCGSQLKSGGGKLELSIGTTCHLDPDIFEDIYIREAGWKGLFGQAGAAQSHLAKQEVSVGDLFLFFGWFRRTIEKDGNLVFDPEDKEGRHIIYGYLQVGEIINLDGNSEIESWMEYHPHIARKSNRKGNTLYVARENLSWNDNLKGYGTFDYRDDLVLTKVGCSRSKWDLPEIFRNANISCHSDENWQEGHFKCVSRGQEFVVEENKLIEDWAKRIVEGKSSSRDVVSIPLKDILNVVKSDRGKDIVNNFMTNVMRYMEDIYGNPENAPKEVLKIVYILGETAKNIEKSCDKMIEGKFIEKFDINDIMVEISKDKFL